MSYSNNYLFPLISFCQSCLMFVLFILKAKQKQKQVCSSLGLFLFSLLFKNNLNYIATLHAYQCISMAIYMQSGYYVLTKCVCYNSKFTLTMCLQTLSVLVACADWTCSSIWCGPFYAACGAGGSFAERLWGETNIKMLCSLVGLFKSCLGDWSKNLDESANTGPYFCQSLCLSSYWGY